MADTVKVQAAQWHTHAGKAYEIGDTYDAPAELVDSLAVQGKAFRTEAPAVAKTARAAKAGRSRKTAVKPMTTESATGKALAKPRVKGARKAKK